MAALNEVVILPRGTAATRAPLSAGTATAQQPLWLYKSGNDGAAKF
jgi:hypothetical protein